MDLTALLARANEAFQGMTPAEQARARREQHISFAWANLALMRPGPRISRQALGRLYDEMQSNKSRGLGP